MTPEELSDIAYQAQDTVHCYPLQQRDGERYTYQYLNREQPSVTGTSAVCLRNKTILRFGYPHVVSRFPEMIWHRASTPVSDKSWAEDIGLNMSEKQFRDFKKNKELLTQDEIKTLQEIAQIKRKEKVTWGV